MVRICYFCLFCFCYLINLQVPEVITIKYLAVWWYLKFSILLLNSYIILRNFCCFYPIYFVYFVIFYKYGFTSYVVTSVASSLYILTT